MGPGKKYKEHPPRLISRSPAATLHLLPGVSRAAKVLFRPQVSLSRKETISSTAEEQNYPFGKTVPRQA